MRGKAEAGGKRRLRLTLIVAVSLSVLPAFAPISAEAQFWRRDKNRQTEEISRPSGADRRPDYQQRGSQIAPPRRSFWDKLFGRGKPPPPYVPPPRAAKQTRPPKPEAIAKNADARRILVPGGDAALADGLSRAYSRRADIIIRSRAGTDIGQIFNDKADWQESLRALLAQEKPQLIILMPSADNARFFAAEDFSDEAKLNIYQEKLQNRLESLQKSGVPWLLLGLPPYQKDSLDTAALTLNHICKKAAEQAGGYFIDIWGGFVSDKGDFAFSGYDVDGKTARLRMADGIGFTAAGRRKLAFYAEQAIEALWGDDNIIPGADGAWQNIRSAPINPLDIGIDAGLHLAGAAPERKRGQMAQKMSESSAEPPAGRADNFSLPKL